MAAQEVRQSPTGKPGFFYGYIVVAAALCIMVVIYGTRFAFGVFFTPMLTEFGWTRAMTSGAFSLSVVMEGFLGIVMGILTDRIGPRIVLTLSGLFVGLGYLLMSQMSDIWQLYVIYGFIIGIGTSGVFVPLVATTARWFIRRRNTMTATVMTGTGIGTLIAAPAATRLISTYDWRISYIILGGVVLLAVVIAAQFLKRDPMQIGQAPYGENKREEQQPGPGREGLSPGQAIYTRQFWMVFAIFFCLGFCVFAIMVHVTPHALDLGFPDTTAGSILAIIGGAAIAGRMILGIAADRIGNRWAIIIGFTLMSAALLWLIRAREVWMFYLFAILFGFAHGGIGPSHSPIVAGLFGLRSHGLIFGANAFSFPLGGAIGPITAGYIFDITGSYQSAFLACALIGIIGLILSLLLVQMKGKIE